MTRPFSLTLIFVFFSFIAGAQTIKTFSEDSNDFLKELKEFMNYSKQPQLKDVHSRFEKMIKDGQFSPEELKSIRTVSENMLKTRLQANPHFMSYLNSCMLIKNDTERSYDLPQWNTFLINLFESGVKLKRNNYKVVFSFGENFFGEGVIHRQTSTFYWSASSAEEVDIAFVEGDMKVSFQDINLHCVRRTDSLLIKNTSGAFYPLRKSFEGKGGLVDWTRFDTEDEIVAELGTFTIETTKGLYSSQNAKLNYPKYFNSQEVKGYFEDKVGTQQKGNKGLYPKFESTGGLVSIDNFGEGIEYRGGFKLSGLTVYGPSVGETMAQLRISNSEGRLKLIGRSKQFKIVTDERITADNVNCSMFSGQDSIVHPNIVMRYDIPKRKLELKRGNAGNQKTPFYSSVHKMNIQAESMNFYINGDSIVVGEKTLQFNNSGTKVSLESENYFSESEFQSFRGGADYNAINVIFKNCQDEGLTMISASTVAESINPDFTAESIETVLYDLVEKGFINYDPETYVIEVRDKVFLYANAAKGGSDFDRIKLESVTEKQDNGIIDLNTGSMKMNGIKNVEFSPEKFVGLKPFKKQVTIQQNRDMDFAGRLFAGYSVFMGEDFHFNYESFNVDMDSTRYFDLFLPIPDARAPEGKLTPAYSLNSRIENLSGVLLIDAPMNKSGTDTISIFPSIQSKNESFIFYDDKSIRSGVYLRDSFYVKLDPFSLNALLSIDRDAVRFKGDLISSNIFPVFPEEITIQPDTSLGFISVTPSSGYPIYQGAGSYVGEMNLSNSGFLGDGTFTYLRASIQSEDIVFMPKQLTASAKDFLLEEGTVDGIEVPRATGNDVKIDWRPYQDSMYVRSTQDAPFQVFNYGTHELDGTLILTPDGLRADGTFSWPDATMISELFSFKKNSIYSDTAEVIINSIDAATAALKTSNLKAAVDFTSNYGEFYSNNSDNYTLLPRNMFSTNLDQFDWDINKRLIIFKPEEDQNGHFLSISEQQDSLGFEGEKATLNLESALLEIEGVPYVRSADAFIYPSDGKVLVWPEARIDTLYEAKIIADTLSKFHVINRAKVKLKGKNTYNASGYYEYNVGPHTQEIEFQDIVGSKSLGKGSYKNRGVVTRAKGVVDSDKQFYIDHKTEYVGEINLQSNQKELFFKGHARLDANISNKHWFSVNFDGDRSDLSIKFERPQNFEGEIIRNGIFLSRETAMIYPRIMSPLYYRKDRQLMEATGILNYDETLDHFRFGDSTKVMNPSTNKGNLIVFENRTGKVKAEGKFNFSEDLDFLNVDAAGRLETSAEVNSDTLNTGPMTNDVVTGEFMLGVDILLPDELEKIMVNDFLNYALDAQGVVYASDVRFYQKAVAELFPDNKDITKAISDIALNTFLIPEKYNKYSFLFNKLNLKWDSDYQSFITLDDKVGLSSINGKPFNKKVTCYMETKMPMQEKDDRYYLYLRSPSGSYYFFGYRGGILNVFSNNSDFTEVFFGYKEKDLLIEVSKEKIMEMQWGNEGTVQSFLNRVRASAKEGE